MGAITETGRRVFRCPLDGGQPPCGYGVPLRPCSR
ncbi:hypothetical protein FuraDRAFT_0995 [Pseudogulbenkiania ferrooxidans 2002]|uniref:Uncharacterized protein n=1 Tax=Pseudogulbenkiania ferrooxidans 2002 TaxID=279714 RepID=B9Z096_9NEIS|nr:hypothetical protein FuraDRAFT_0995 [Pseudogulbenkiania ferrooxidans 2002]